MKSGQEASRLNFISDELHYAGHVATVNVHLMMLHVQASLGLMLLFQLSMISI
jgi:hypothetical protein